MYTPQGAQKLAVYGSDIHMKHMLSCNSSFISWAVETFIFGHGIEIGGVCPYKILCVRYFFRALCFCMGNFQQSVVSL